jgi:hypothetical protein
MKPILDIEESVPVLYRLGTILTFVLNLVVVALGYAIMVIDGVVEGFNYIYAFMIQSLTMMPFPLNFFIFYFVLSAIPLAMVLLVLLMLHHAFTHESFGAQKMTIFPLYILSAPSDGAAVKYPNKACETFAHSILLWILFLHIFIVVAVVF